MDRDQITERVKEMIADVGDLDPQAIGDDAHFLDELELDSLALLELGVDLDYEFKLGLPDERLQKLRTVDEAVELILAHRGGAESAKREVA
ncbi:MAG: acyl carrier protein [Thermoanaerobaculia bacterium]|nr:acyl carrier protein [Thermoanaerobaculia bacterium]